MNPAAPIDWLLNLGRTPHWPELAATAPTLCVLQHGLIRSATSMARLARTLKAHGYQVLNPSYPSTTASLTEHAARLHRAIEARLSAAGGSAGPPRLAFIGHSMGGLVIRAYLSRPDARPAFACVFLGTPQRGARLAAVAHRLAPVRLVLGRHAPAQLLPGDPIYASLPTLQARHIGVIYGARGDGRGWNRHLEGDDDGRVSVAEAQLEEASDALALRIGHTRITLATVAIRQVVFFLARGRFEHSP